MIKKTRQEPCQRHNNINKTAAKVIHFYNELPEDWADFKQPAIFWRGVNKPPYLHIEFTINKPLSFEVPSGFKVIFDAPNENVAILWLSEINKNCSYGPFEAVFQEPLSNVWMIENKAGEGDTFSQHDEKALIAAVKPVLDGIDAVYGETDDVIKAIKQHFSGEVE